VKTEQEIKDRLRQLLKNSGIKEKSQKAAIIEQSFLMGMMFANESYNTAYFQILLMSGRSILKD
jgi:hypothetical protein